MGYAWRTTQLTLLGDDGLYGIGNTPQSVMDEATINPDGSATILAVGDIVSCSEADGIKREVAALASLVGLNRKLDRNEVSATKTVELAQKWPTSPILALGDIVYDDGTPQEFANCFDPIWGPLNHRTLPAPGNHEYNTPAAYAYYDYWGQQAGPNRSGFYAVNYGNWLILSLNSEIDASPTSTQGEWLTNILVDASAKCMLAFYHRPAHSSRKRRRSGSEHDLFKTLAAAGVDVILNGHNHFYERTYPMLQNGSKADQGGTVSFVVGTGGRSFLKRYEAATFTASLIIGLQGILKLDLHPDSYRWAFQSLDADAIDEGQRACNAF